MARVFNKIKATSSLRSDTIIHTKTLYLFENRWMKNAHNRHRHIYRFLNYVVRSQRLFFKIFLFGFFVFSSSSVFSQVETDSSKQEKMVVIKMKNGAEYKGFISKMGSDIIILQTVNGELRLIAENVRSIEKYDYLGKFEFANPHETRYFFGPSGIPIKKGEGYYQNLLLTTNFFNYGLTDKISIGGGFEFISSIAGYPIWFLTPKAGFEVSKNIHLGGGFIMAGFANQGSATLGYGVVTLGHSESNFSVGAGYGLLDGQFSELQTIMVSGTHRLSNNLALLTENYFIQDNVYFGIHGVRILSKKSSFDIGGIVIPEIIDVVAALPFIGYARRF